MLHTIKKILLSITLSEDDPASEEAYRRYKAQISSESLIVSIIVVLAQEAFSIAMGVVYGDFIAILAHSGLFAVTLLLALIRKRLEKYFEVLLFTISCITQILASMNLGIQFQKLPRVALYAKSYFLGIFQQLLIAWMYRFKLALAFNFISITLRCTINFFVSFKHDDEYIIGTIAPVCIDIMFLYVMYNIERNDRKMFKKFHGYTSIENDFEQIFLRYMPQSVLVLNQDLKKALFANESFTQTFTELDHPNAFRKPLETLRVKRKDFNVRQKFSYLFEEGQTIISLSTFLERALLKRPKKGTEVLVVNASYSHSQVTNNNKTSFEVTIFQVPVYKGHVFTIMFNSISLQKDLISIQAADASKDKMLATISHELKTPLHGMVEGLNMTLRTAKDMETLSCLKVTKKSTELLIATVNSLLDLQLIRRNKLKLDICKVNLNNILSDLESLFELQCTTKGLFFNRNLSPDVPKWIQTDKRRLKLTLTNLIGNSIKFTSTGGVTLRVSMDPNYEGNILFQVEDTGVGMTLEEQTRFCKALGQCDYDEAEEIERVGTHGVGLGLMISNSLAKVLNYERQNGGIKVTSEHKKGSIFSFSISYQPIIDSRDSIEEDLTSFIEELEGLKVDVEAKINRYTQRKGIASRNLENSRLNISGVSQLNEQDESCLLGIRSRPRELSLPNPTPKGVNQSILTFPYAFKERREGKVFSITVTPPDSGTLKSKTEFSSYANLKGWVLLVDDNSFNLMVATKIVEEMGSKVITAINGEDAIKKAKENFKSGNAFFKLILMDCQMPIMDGYEATKILKAMMAKNEFPSCPIVALTANDSEEDIKRCKACGMDDVLSKPLKEDDIQKLQMYLKE